MSKIEIKLQFPYEDQAQYEHHTAAELIPIYNTTVYKTKSYVALNVVKLFAPIVKDTNKPQGRSV